MLSLRLRWSRSRDWVAAKQDPMITKTSSVTERTTTYYLDGKAILNALIESRALAPEDLKDAVVTFRVPGGADWSNCNVDVDDHPITISVIKTTREES